ncbi:hypothetical protein Lalb_Chr06g0160611 [Lupinus albus]|uniref:Uncharacterized protein n=1 Tax=Lupinus albus TaxID=3870 RepID=A0A6A4QAK8_LUPAL|nr:hypothetical protein Lalb_Chr06g0160611 [Lupinus albus]
MHCSFGRDLASLGHDLASLGQPDSSSLGRDLANLGQPGLAISVMSPLLSQSLICHGLGMLGQMHD